MTATTVGEARKRKALAALERGRPRYVLLAKRAFLLALLRSPVMQCVIEDVYNALPEDFARFAGSSKFLGAVPVAFARSGMVKRVGYRPTVRPEARARPVAVWQLADTAAAAAWLDANPHPRKILADQLAEGGRPDLAAAVADTLAAEADRQPSLFGEP